MPALHRDSRLAEIHHAVRIREDAGTPLLAKALISCRIWLYCRELFRVDFGNNALLEDRG